MLIIECDWRFNGRREYRVSRGSRKLGTIREGSDGRWRVDGGPAHPTAEAAIRANWREGDVRRELLRTIAETREHAA